MKQPTHFLALDGLRGMAVLLVLVSHLSNFGFDLLGIDFSGIGKAGVYLFFVLSAFLLTYQFLEKGAEGFTGRSLCNYVWRRSLRVLPLFYIVVVASAITTYFFSGMLNGRGLPFTIYPQDFVPHLLLQAGTEVLWSVPVEFKFYFLLPIVAGLFILTGKRGVIVDCLLLIAGIVGAFLAFPPSSFPGGTVELGYFLPVFIFGCFCAAVVFKAPANNYPGLAGVLAIGSGLLIVITIPSVFSFVVAPVAPSHFHKAFILYGALWSCFLYGVLHAQGVVQKVFCTTPFIFLGKISFSLYLLHFPVLLIARKLAPGNLWVGWLSVGLIILISYISYRGIERPLSRFQIFDILPSFLVRSRSSGG